MTMMVEATPDAKDFKDFKSDIETGAAMEELNENQNEDEMKCLSISLEEIID